MKNVSLGLVVILIVLSTEVIAADYPYESWRADLYENWKNLPEPPVTPYDGPFGPSARAFTETDQAYLSANRATMSADQIANLSAVHDYSHSAKNGVYDPEKDPRPINEAYEKAILEDWNRMGYNCAYKGNSFTYMVGRFLKQNGMLGAIDQTLWGQNTLRHDRRFAGHSHPRRHARHQPRQGPDDGDALHARGHVQRVEDQPSPALHGAHLCPDAEGLRGGLPGAGRDLRLRDSA